MKILTRIVSAILVVSMLFAFTACDSTETDSPLGDLVKSDDSEIVMQIGDHYLTEREFYYVASYIKDSVLYYYQSYYYEQYGMAPSIEEILKMPHPADEKRMFSDYIEECAIEVAQQLLVLEKLCADNGLKITNAEDIKAITDYMQELEYAYGGEDLFNIKLEELGYSKSGIARVQQMYCLSDILLEHRYGDNGTARIPEETVNKYFLDNYYKYDGASYNYFNTVDEIDGLYTFEDDEIVDYFKENYVRVNHVLYITVDKKTNKPLSDEDKAKKKAAAEAALTAINSDSEKTLKDFEKENEDSNFQYTFTYGEMVDAFEKAAFGEWSEGEIKLVETEYGYHLMEKVEMSDDDVKTTIFGTTDENGKNKAGIKNNVIVKMANAKIKEIAEEEIKKLENGDFETYPDEKDDAKYYELREAAFVAKDDSSFATLTEMIKDADCGEYVWKELRDGVYVVRKLEFTAEDITPTIFNKIEDSFISDAYWEYIQSFYETIDINKELIDKIDFVKLPTLEKEFYSAS